MYYIIQSRDSLQFLSAKSSDKVHPMWTGIIEEAKIIHSIVEADRYSKLWPHLDPVILSMVGTEVYGVHYPSELVVNKKGEKMRYAIYNAEKMKFLQANCTINEPLWSTTIETAMYFDEFEYAAMWSDFLKDCKLILWDGFSWAELDITPRHTPISQE